MTIRALQVKFNPTVRVMKILQKMTQPGDACTLKILVYLTLFLIRSDWFASNLERLRTPSFMPKSSKSSVISQLFHTTKTHHNSCYYTITIATYQSLCSIIICRYFSSRRMILSNIALRSPHFVVTYRVQQQRKAHPESGKVKKVWILLS